MATTIQPPGARPAVWHTEIMPARKYYRRATPGWIVLVNGQPFHFVGPLGGTSAKRRAAEFMTRAAQGDLRPRPLD